MTSLTVVPVPGFGAEDVVVDDAGDVYTGTDDGSIFRVVDEGRRIERVGRTTGRPLGLELLADGRLLVCDAYEGLLTLDRDTGKLEVLAQIAQGERIKVCNNAAVHSDGRIFFSDSSKVFDLARWKADLTENTATGRLLCRAPDGTVTTLVDGLRFANGVALAADESFVAVAESGGRSVVRHWLTGDHAGRTAPFVEELPGYPDNIARGSDGLIWVTLASPVLPVLERLMRGPMALRRLAWRMPAALQPKPRRSVRVVAYDADGRVVHDRSLDSTDYHMVTGVREHRGRVWLGSLEEPAVAYFDL